MVVLKNVFLILGAVSVFLFGLKQMSEQATKLANKKIEYTLKKVCSNAVSSALAGVISTALIQSSIATNVIAISFVEGNIISFANASALLMGTNIGTTITAQLVSLSNVGQFDVTAIGCLIGFIGILLSFFNNEKLNSLGLFFLGFEFVFIGLQLMTTCVNYFKTYQWFTNIFLVKSPLLLFLNGLFLTAIIQSSSVTTSIMVILGSLGLISFYNSMFLIMGANVGACFCVIIASAKLSENAQKTALFNLIFNVFGSLLFFVPLLLFGERLSNTFIFSASNISRKIANFHTLFNFTVCLVIMPLLRYFVSFTEKVYFYFHDKSNIKNKTLSVSNLLNN